MALSTRALVLSGLAAAALAGTACFPQDANGPTVCLDWNSQANSTTINMVCDAGNSTLGKTLNWCALGVRATAPGASNQMFPAEVFMMIPSSTGNSLVVENRANVAHQTPACFPTQVLTLLNSSITTSPSGGQLYQAAWSRPRYITDPTLQAQGHFNLTTGTTTVISAATQSAYTNYAACDTTQLQYHTWVNGGMTLNWDL